MTHIQKQNSRINVGNKHSVFHQGEGAFGSGVANSFTTSPQNNTSETTPTTFYRIPKALFADSCFREISLSAKILYGMLLDRMTLSTRHSLDHAAAAACPAPHSGAASAACGTGSPQTRFTRNAWQDGDGQVFVYFTLEEAQEQLCCGHCQRQ